MKPAVLLCIFMFSLAFYSCTGRRDATSRELLNLREVQRQLHGRIHYQDSLTEDYLASLLQVSRQLRTTWTLLDTVRRGVNFEASGIEVLRGRISDDLQVIDSLIQHNKRDIRQMEERLQQLRYHYPELTSALARLQQDFRQQLSVKDSIIFDLKWEIRMAVNKADRLRSMRYGLEKTLLVKEMTLEDQQNTFEEQEQQSATGFYICGTATELLQKGILRQQKKRFIIGSKKHVYSGQTGRGLFTAVNIYECSSLLLPGTKPRVVTSHPENAYRLEKVQGTFRLVITNAESFWKVSRYLVVSSE